MGLCCKQDERRDALRRAAGWNGLDYVEVGEDQLTLRACFLGKLPPEFAVDGPDLARYLRIEGGRRVTGIRIVGVEPAPDPDPDKDDFLLIRLDKYGDFSTYVLRLAGVRQADPRYDHARFSFKVGCPSDLDCAGTAPCVAAPLPAPAISYLAKDYLSFRQLILDRLALLMPGWTERHAPDLGIALAELLAYSGDMLSYYQDAVATEAFLDTARQRISVRRHARLVDYQLHEGCNARAWICIGTDTDYPLELDDAVFVTALPAVPGQERTILGWDELRALPPGSFEVFEPLLPGRGTRFALRAAHNEIHFYTWGERLCCLARGSTSATLLDRWDGEQRALALAPGDVLLFEEVRGPATGLPGDADPRHRHAVRLARVTPAEDQLLRTADGRPTPVLEIEWAAEDALPFALCISAQGQAPGCALVDNASVARGNVILADHGWIQPPEALGAVPLAAAEGECECVGQPRELVLRPGRFTPRLARTPLTFAAPLPADAEGQWASASSLVKQDPRAALAQLRLATQDGQAWSVRQHLLDSGRDERAVVVEIDNDGVARLRFGDGELGMMPPAGASFSAVYRTGNGAAGNAGPLAISRIALRSPVSGLALTVRNPLPAGGGSEPEPLAEARLFAPQQFRQVLARAVIADDYRVLAERHPGLQRAAAALEWTGSWYEAEVAVDPLGAGSASDGLLEAIRRELDCLRRIGHDLRVTRAQYVPLHLELQVCALPHHQRAHVKAALLDAFSNRVLADGRLGFFHPDRVSFGEPVLPSVIVATAQAVPGVECATVKVLQRLFEPANSELAHGILPLRAVEIAQLDNDPDYPEHGKLVIEVLGGR